MQNLMLTLIVCGLSPIVLQADEISQLPIDAVKPLTAPKPLIPLEQIDGPLPDGYVIAKLDGQPIRLSELFESGGYTERLEMMREMFIARQFRSTQERLLKRDLKPYLELRLCAREFRRQFSKEQNDKFDRALHDMWQKELKKLQARFEVGSVEALEEQLRQRGVQSLSSIRRNFENRTLAAEYCRSQVGAIEDSNAKAKAVQGVLEKLFAEADLQTVIDLSDKPAETSSTESLPHQRDWASFSKFEGPLPDLFLTFILDHSR